MLIIYTVKSSIGVANESLLVFFLIKYIAMHLKYSFN